MFIKTRYMVITGIAVICVMAAEWKYLRWSVEAGVVHKFHGVCNDGVGQPYTDFIRALRGLAQKGDTNALVRVLVKADKSSRDIYEVWLAKIETPTKTAFVTYSSKL
jgi:hypothetical protein